MGTFLQTLFLLSSLGPSPAFLPLQVDRGEPWAPVLALPSRTD
jgi:hypothetical protein